MSILPLDSPLFSLFWYLLLNEILSVCTSLWFSFMHSLTYSIFCMLIICWLINLNPSKLTSYKNLFESKVSSAKVLFFVKWLMQSAAKTFQVHSHLICKGLQPKLITGDKVHTKSLIFLATIYISVLKYSSKFLTKTINFPWDRKWRMKPHFYLHCSSPISWMRNNPHYTSPERDVLTKKRSEFTCPRVQLTLCSKDADKLSSLTAVL